MRGGQRKLCSALSRRIEPKSDLWKSVPELHLWTKVALLPALTCLLLDFEICIVPRSTAVTHDS